MTDPTSPDGVKAKTQATLDAMGNAVGVDMTGFTDKLATGPLFEQEMHEADLRTRPRPDNLRVLRPAGRMAIDGDIGCASWL